MNLACSGTSRWMRHICDLQCGGWSYNRSHRPSGISRDVNYNSSYQFYLSLLGLSFRIISKLLFKYWQNTNDTLSAPCFGSSIVLKMINKQKRLRQVSAFTSWELCKQLLQTTDLSKFDYLSEYGILRMPNQT